MRYTQITSYLAIETLVNLNKFMLLFISCNFILYNFLFPYSSIKVCFLAFKGPPLRNNLHMQIITGGNFFMEHDELIIRD